MDQSESAAGGLAGKRPWDEGRDETSTPDSGGGGEPPTKAVGNRRPSFKPRPTIPAGPRAEAKPPLQSTPPGSGDGALATTDLAKVSGPNATTGQQPAAQPLELQPGKGTASERPESSEPPGKEPAATAGQEWRLPASGLAGKRPWDEGDAATGKMVTLPASKSKLEERREPPAGELQDQGPAVVKAATSKDTCQPTSEDTKVAENQETCMEVVESASGQPIKRPLEEIVEEKADKRGEGTEPPFKEMTTRRTSMKPRPNISAERRSADKPPP
ncbi:hypothetical protein HPB49_008045 [Dermacentor silvarum]|uniref:Uncharacterized protein n=1 Tax=Dermacentor silvarum TaxID=543639 RepID=A0ACB8DX27_DERSI|nr:hypothetical protein HPB49_008045 [Dermacentor silvarum]